MADSVSPECLDQEFYKEKSTNVALLGTAAWFLPSEICFFSSFLTQYIKTSQLERGGQHSFCLMFSFILVKRKTTDSEFKYCCGDYQLYKTKQRERVIYKIISFFSVKKKSL